MGIHTQCFPGDRHIIENLNQYKPDFVLNLVDSVYGQETLCASIPATLELLQIPYTGAGMLGLSLNTNKFLTKNLLWQYGITTPKYQLVTEPSEEIDPVLDYPLISKLNEVHGSIEMDDTAIAHNEADLRKRLKYLITTYKMPVLVEEFIVGREVAVHVVEGLNTKVYAGEKVFNEQLSGPYKIATFDAVWGTEDIYTYAKYELPESVKSQLKKGFEILKLDDYGKFDLRVDASNRHYVIDVNSNPSLGPKGECSIGNVLALYGIEFEELLSRLIQNTLAD
jgi:D-alanine-D-alanine ligase